MADYVHMFAVADDPPIAASPGQSRNRGSSGRRARVRRHRQGFDVVGRVDRLLDAIQTMILHTDAAAAFELLVLLIESDGELGANCDEDDLRASQAFGRACDLLVTAAGDLPSEQTPPVLACPLAR